MTQKIGLIRKGIYQHYKGNYYEVIDTATHSETLEVMVVYRALHDDLALWIRPLQTFLEQVEMDNKQVTRFQWRGESVQEVG